MHVTLSVCVLCTVLTSAVNIAVNGGIVARRESCQCIVYPMTGSHAGVHGGNNGKLHQFLIIKFWRFACCSLNTRYTAA